MLLRKEHWPGFMATLTEGGRAVWAPVEQESFTHFAPVAGDAALFDPAFSNSTVPPKNIFSPQTETLYRFYPGEKEIEEPVLEGAAVLLGIRPCDARALTMLEKLFRWGVNDPYFVKRRELFTIIGLACREPGLNCFCTSLGGGPASTTGLDLLLHDLGEAFLIQVVTSKGRTLLEEVREHLIEAPADAHQAALRAVEAAAAKIQRVVDPSGIPEGLPGLWEAPLWQSISNSCLGCGTCTFLCPTCYCFDIQDETEDFQGRRYRTWDSCMFEEYTRHSSGHNPRPSRRERTRNRINHKYSYFVEKFGEIACVGCGRCINLCPANIDLLEILQQVKGAI